jgi:hypothetical protein
MRSTHSYLPIITTWRPVLILPGRVSILLKRTPPPPDSEECGSKVIWTKWKENCAYRDFRLQKEHAECEMTFLFFEIVWNSNLIIWEVMREFQMVLAMVYNTTVLKCTLYWVLELSVILYSKWHSVSKTEYFGTAIGVNSFWRIQQSSCLPLFHLRMEMFSF